MKGLRLGPIAWFFAEKTQFCVTANAQRRFPKKGTRKLKFLISQSTAVIWVKIRALAGFAGSHYNFSKGVDLPQKERLNLIKELEEVRGSRVICYVTGDRAKLETKIGMDVFPFFYDVCARIGQSDRVDLFLYSTGGSTMAAWGLVNLIREFFEGFTVLLPFKAHSSATLLALGANEIVMSRAAQLSPIDPSVNSPYNPILQVEGSAPEVLPVSVEDVIGFMDLVRNEAKIGGEDNLTRLVETLAKDVRPMALGSVYRAKEQIRMLAKKLLSFHMDSSQESQIDATVSSLTKDLYSHDYLIGRKEAKGLLGLKVGSCSDDLEKKMMTLFQAYAEDLRLTATYSADAELGNQSTKAASFERAFIESSDRSFVFKTKRELKRIKLTKEGIPLEAFHERLIEEGWVEVPIKG